jgi:hypothetical protein
MDLSHEQLVLMAAAQGEEQRVGFQWQAVVVRACQVSMIPSAASRSSVLEVRQI